MDWLAPMTLQQLADQAFALQQQGRIAEAERLYAQMLAVVPDNAVLQFNHGIVLQDLHRFDEALTRFDRALAIRPDYAEAWNNRGLVLSDMQRFDDALASFDHCLVLQPDHAGVLNNRGVALSGLQRFEEALASFDHALRVAPDFAAAHNARGNSLRALQRFDEALASFNKALAIYPGEAGIVLNCGLVLSDLGRFEEALARFKEAMVLQPGYAEAWNNCGLVLQYLGHGEDARTAYAKALALDPGMTSAYLNYAGSVTFCAGDPHMGRMEALATRSAALGRVQRVQLDFALAKAHADLKDYQRSFQHLLSGNALRRAQLHYDEDAELAVFDRIAATFTAARLREKESIGGADFSTAPIFILGMPRSGSTLIEQILASHPLVHGAGELTAFHDAMKTVRGTDGTPLPYPEFVPGLDATAIGRIASGYLARIRKLAPDTSHVTDKMPSNYYHVGLIHLALPGARIIHTVRDPLDTCISRFAKLFIDRQSYSYDLAELGRYHRRYEMLMAHWHRVLPKDRILDVRYEDVVADLEGEARRILAHCGLPWDTRCLSFHAETRPVRTPSALQVRQPIYRNAVGHAQAYEEFLGPLRDALAGR